MEYDMDKFDQRRHALDALIQGLGHGGISQVAERIGMDASYVSRLRYPPDKPGFKRIGEDTAEKLSRAYPGWLGPGRVSETTRTWPPDCQKKTAPPTLEQCVEVLALHINQLAPEDRDAAKSLFQALVSSPAIHASISASLKSLIERGDANHAQAA